MDMAGKANTDTVCLLFSFILTVTRKLISVATSRKRVSPGRAGLYKGERWTLQTFPLLFNFLKMVTFSALPCLRA